MAIICTNDTTITLNNAFDADGDRLVYSFGQPYGNVPGSNFGLAGPNAPDGTPSTPTYSSTFAPPPNPAPYFPGYSVTAPFGTGPGNFAIINANTGVAKYGGTAIGLYGVAVDVAEYRTINGVSTLIGTTRRDLQLVLSTCPSTAAPVLTSTSVTPRNYTIEEGQSVTFPIRATQSANNPLVMTANSALLDGSGPFNASFNGSQGTVAPGNPTGTATAVGNGTVSGTFLFNSVCGNAKATPYDVAVSVKDNGCGGKLIADVFRITVNKAAPPTGITGPTSVCDPATVRTYTAVGPVPGRSYNWHITGGTITGGQGTNTVTVRWNSAILTGVLSLKNISSFGCPHRFGYEERGRAAGGQPGRNGEQHDHLPGRQHHAHRERPGQPHLHPERAAGNGWPRGG